jgi:hypothetical protein
MNEVLEFPSTGAELNPQFATIINNIHNTLSLQNLISSTAHKKLDEIFTVLSSFPDANRFTVNEFLAILDRILEMNKCSEEKYTRVLGGVRMVRKTTHPK